MSEVTFQYTDDALQAFTENMRAVAQQIKSYHEELVQASESSLDSWQMGARQAYESVRQPWDAAVVDMAQEAEIASHAAGQAHDIYRSGTTRATSYWQ